LRPRLKLTPTASDEAVSAVFEAADRPQPAAAPVDPDDEDEEERPSELWTWKDLLASLNGPEAPADPDEAPLAGELSAMGLDLAALLPQPRIEQIAAALQAGDRDGARQVVKRLAGAGARRIVRRLFTDEDLKVRAEAYVGRFDQRLEDAKVRDPEGFAAAGLLGSDGGRVFLLLDQALGDAA
jgi:hypothetical protein